MEKVYQNYSTRCRFRGLRLDDEVQCNVAYVSYYCSRADLEVWKSIIFFSDLPRGSLFRLLYLRVFIVTIDIIIHSETATASTTHD